MINKAFIAGCSGHSLTPQERDFFADQRPWGFILFARNIDNPDQVKRLCAELGDAIGESNPPILIDQEGGRVQRLRTPHWSNYPAGAALGALYEYDAAKGKRACWLLSRLHAFDLLPLGINVDCLPVLDVPVSGGHDVIGNRAYSDRAETIALLGQCACDGLKAGGVMPVIKHIPGHGRATADSHKELPVVDASRSALEQSDFIPFKRLAGEVMAMTAHVIYTALDKELPATTSPFIINDIIRKEMGFDGLLMSDDVSMHALSGDFSSRTRAIFGAGCDIVLHCNGDMAEMQEVAQSAPELAGLALKRANLAMQSAGQCDNSNEAEVRAEFEELMSVLPAS